MAYDKEKIFNQAITAIEENNLCFIEDVVSYLPCAKSTFYKLFQEESDESNAIKEALDKNKTRLKIYLRRKWEESDNPTQQLALYRLLATDEERKKLSTSYQEHSGKDGAPLMSQVTVKVINSREELNELNLKN